MEYSYQEKSCTKNFRKPIISCINLNFSINRLINICIFYGYFYVTLIKYLCFPYIPQSKLCRMTSANRKLRLDFARRLIEALAFAGLDDSPTTLARHFNLHSHGMVITMHGARRWLVGDSIPTQSHLNALASLLGVSSAWLLLGQGPMLEDAVSIEPAQTSSSSNLGEVLGIFQSLRDSERQLVWNLMMMLNRSHRHSA